MNTEARHALNKEHTIRPQVGDVWHEMFCVVYLVIWTDGEHIEYLDHTHKKDVDRGHWTWTFEKPAIRKTIEAFAKGLHYGSIAGCWADVVPNAANHA